MVQRRGTVSRVDTLACPEGLEPPTCCLEGSCSIQLSYGQRDGILGGPGGQPRTNHGMPPAVPYTSGAPFSHRGEECRHVMSMLDGIKRLFARTGDTERDQAELADWARSRQYSFRPVRGEEGGFVIEG